MLIFIIIILRHKLSKNLIPIRFFLSHSQNKISQLN
jgi:hypothetical protein